MDTPIPATPTTPPPYPTRPSHTVFPDTSVVEAIRQLHSQGARLLAVCDAEGHLLGTFSSRTAQELVLQGADLARTVASAMDNQPETASEFQTPRQIRRAVASSPSLSLPVIASNGRLIRMAVIEQDDSSPLEASALVLAGGLGLRMRPLTDGTPKPMLPIHGQPILQHILEELESQGVTTVYLAVNYRADQIAEYFGDGGALGLSLSYLRESVPLGTAGSLRMLPSTVRKPLLVMNGDVLARVDYRRLLAEHHLSRAHATVCTWDYSVTIPYGEVVTEGDMIVALREKPTLQTEISAGIYVLGAEIIALVPDARLDMPDLVSKALAAGLAIRRHRLTDMWIDIGEPREYQRAQESWQR